MHATRTAPIIHPIIRLGGPSPVILGRESRITPDPVEPSMIPSTALFSLVDPSGTDWTAHRFFCIYSGCLCSRGDASKAVFTFGFSLGDAFALPLNHELPLFSTHCYRSMLATDFAAYGLSSSLRKPRAASSFETSRNDSCPALGRRLRSLRARATTSGLVSLRAFLPSHRPSRSRLRLRAAASFATLLAFSN
jgi:hypothetical protein